MSILIFPHVLQSDDPSILDGTLIKAPKFCIGMREKCAYYYQSIFSKDGFHICPYGLSSYVFEDESFGRTVMTSVKIKGHYEKSKAKKRTKDVFSPVLDVEQVYASLNKFKQKKIAMSPNMTLVRVCCTTQFMRLER